MKITRTAFLGWTAFTIIFGAGALAATPPYSFIDFEAGSGWKVGQFPADSASAKLIQGSASIVSMSEQDSQQALQLGPSKPFPAFFVNASAVSKSVTVYGEVLAKPFAVNANSGEEFLNFGGAVLGFFKQGNQGGIEALSATSDTASAWISTGMRFSLDNSGLPAQWIRVTVMLDRNTGRWNLQIDGVRVLTGLQAVPGAAAGLALWLYGSESHPSYFDDILLSADDPNHLERMVILQNERRRIKQLRAATSSVPQVVTQAEQDSQLRQAQPNLSVVAQKLTAPVLRDWQGILQNGDTTLKTGTAGVMAGNVLMRLMAYAPRVDANGKPMPMTLTIVADAELKPGTDLHQLRWIVAEMTEWPNELGDVMATGDFSTGLVQTVPISGKWVEKATTIYVWREGPDDDLHKYFRLTKGLTPEVTGTAN
jgi:hypothetical protein